MAAENGRFWEFANAFYGLQTMPTRETVLRLAESVGLSRDDVERRLRDESDRATARLTADMAFAEGIGVHSTPTFVVVLKGFPPQSATARGLERLLNSELVVRALMQERRE